jgi:hypothetical protein
MTGTQPIQATAAVAHLRYTARRVAINDRYVELQAEWLAADLIEWQERRIERMRAALKQARTVIAVDRESFVQCATAPHQPLDPDDQCIVDEYDALLRQIDDAMGGNDASE